MQLVPNSAGSVELREYNACHDPDNGQFAMKGQGRCLGMDARVGARALDDKRYGLEGYRGHDSYLLDPRNVMVERHRIMKLDPHTRTKILDARKAARNYGKHTPLPAYLQGDAKAARRADGTLVLFYDGSEMVSNANHVQRIVKLHMGDPARKGKEYSKTATLSVLRHEVGHVDRTPLGAGGMSIGGLKVSRGFAEEIRAWKNALRNSEGKISMRQMEQALASYMWLEDPVQRATVLRYGVTFYHDPIGGVTAMTNDGSNVKAAHRFALQRGNRLVRARVMPVMRRYQARVRRASKQAA